jgi:uncharacterized protein (DUF305 family)
MYLLMYAMVNIREDIFLNTNQIYMASLMAAPMVLIELFVMGAMYGRKTYNYLLIIGALIVMGGSFLAIRQQVLVSDRQFLKSMIPHHSAAVLMCEKAQLKDPQIKSLCQSIIDGQQKEIDWMKIKLEKLP